jgi:hypothetical protein
MCWEQLKVQAPSSGGAGDTHLGILLIRLIRNGLRAMRAALLVVVVVCVLVLVFMRVPLNRTLVLR